MSLLTPRFKHAGKQRRHERLIAALSIKPRTAAELWPLLFCTKDAVIKIIKVLRQEPKREVRVAQWRRARYGFKPVYGLGSAPDARKPKPRTKGERYHAAKRDPISAERLLQRLIERNRKRRNAKFPHLTRDVLARIKDNGEATCIEIARHLRMAYRSIEGAVLELERDKLVMRTPNTAPIIWTPYVDQLAVAQADIVRIVRERWAPMPIPKQSIFAALGL